MLFTKISRGCMKKAPTSNIHNSHPSNGPTEELLLEETFEIDGEKVPKVLGCTSLEYNGEYSSLKFLVGTE